MNEEVSMVRVSGDIYAIAFRDEQGSIVVRTLAIQQDGAISPCYIDSQAYIDSLECFVPGVDNLATVARASHHADKGWWSRLHDRLREVW